MMKKHYKKIILCVLFIIAIILGCDRWIEYKTHSSIYHDIEKVPSCKTALILGTSKKINDLYENLYFTYRMDAAAELYKKGKVRYFIVSGDNHTKGYDEPNDMKQALIERGVPANCIYLDYAGFRTFDSVWRTKDIFSENNIIIVSQEFHNARALFIAQHLNVKAIGYNAKDVSKKYGFMTQLREKLARVKCIIDLYIVPAKPHFGGAKITIGK